jgi:hypothetical protein
MDFAIFATAFNIGKLFNKAGNAAKTKDKSPIAIENPLFFVLLIKCATLKNIESKPLDFVNKIVA